MNQASVVIDVEVLMVDVEGSLKIISGVLMICSSEVRPVMCGAFH